MRLIDGHVHSEISDGTDSPQVLVRLAAEAGLEGIALTDHDTFDGWEAATASAKESGLILVRGVELSTSYKGSSSHLLAYLPDPTDAELAATVDKLRGAREQRLRWMVDAIGTDYPLITWDRLLEQQQEDGVPWGRPHLADLLIEEGYVADRGEAFSRLLSPGSPYFMHQWAPQPPEMVEIVRRAGGVPVLAHPLSKGRQRPLPESVIAEMTDAGLFGLERNHREHDGAARAEVDRMARRFHLATSGGSDYHGTGKPNRLGENVLDRSVLEAITEQGRIPLVGVN